MINNEREGIKEHIESIINYLWDDEERNFEECDRPKDHIFNKLKSVRYWLESPYCPLVDIDELEELEEEFKE